MIYPAGALIYWTIVLCIVGGIIIFLVHGGKR